MILNIYSCDNCNQRTECGTVPPGWELLYKPLKDYGRHVHPFHLCSAKCVGEWSEKYLSPYTGLGYCRACSYSFSNNAFCKCGSCGPNRVEFAVE